MEIKLKDLLEAGCHFGHRVSRWNPKMKPYIFRAQDNVHIFDLVKTKEGLEGACNFVRQLVAKGGKIVFIGTKKQAKEIIKEAALRAGMPYVNNRWVGGTITNWEVIKKNLDRLQELKSKMDKGEFKKYTKKENLLINKEISKLEKEYGGISQLENFPEAIFVVDVHREQGAIKEANKKGVKVVGIVDSNADPDTVDYIIPANDDAIKSISLLTSAIVDAILEGKKHLNKEKKTETEAEEKKEKKKRIKK